jgi:hypothetical protein
MVCYRCEEGYNHINEEDTIDYQERPVPAPQLFFYKSNSPGDDYTDK